MQSWVGMTLVVYSLGVLAYFVPCDILSFRVLERFMPKVSDKEYFHNSQRF